MSLGRYNNMIHFENDDYSLELIFPLTIVFLLGWAFFGTCSRVYRADHPDRETREFTIKSRYPTYSFPDRER